MLLYWRQIYAAPQIDSVNKSNVSSPAAKSQPQANWPIEMANSHYLIPPDRAFLDEKPSDVEIYLTEIRKRAIAFNYIKQKEDNNTFTYFITYITKKGDCYQIFSTQTASLISDKATDKLLLDLKQKVPLSIKVSDLDALCDEKFHNSVDARDLKIGNKTLYTVIGYGYEGGSLESMRNNLNSVSNYIKQKITALKIPVKISLPVEFLSRKTAKPSP